MSSSMPRILVGFNLPWSHYGADFGVRHPRNREFWPSDGIPPWRAPEDGRTMIANTLDKLRDIGFSVIRWFIIADGGDYGVNYFQDSNHIWQMNLQIEDWVPHLGNDNKWHVGLPAPLSGEFVDDFIFMLTAMRDARMKVIPVLIDFGFCFDGDPLSLSPRIKGGRYELINNPTKRGQFLNLVLRTLATQVRREGLQDVIYAWDLINEPEWCTDVSWPRTGLSIGRTHLWSGFRQPNVSLDNMKAFIREGCAIISDINNSLGASFRTTVGFVSRESPRVSGEHAWNDSSLGVTLHQFHFRDIYADLEQVSRFWTPGSCFIGEINDGLGAVISGISQGLYERLRIIDQRGYPAAFIWPQYKPPNDPFKFLTPRDIAEIRRYVSGM